MTNTATIPATVSTAPTRLKRLEPRPDQVEAADKVIAAWETNHSAQLIAACGTGKTIMMATLLEKTSAARSVMFVPTLTLIAQHAATMSRQVNGQVIMAAACSDDTLTRAQKDGTQKPKRGRIDQAEMTEQDLGIKVLHTPDEIDVWYRSNAGSPLPLLLFSTYKSAQDVVDAQWADNSSTPVFDVALMDEAHHLVGHDSDGVEGETVKHKDDGHQRLRAHKRVYATATPKTATAAVRKAIAEHGGDHTDFMDDDSPVYGPWAHHMSFGEAIEAGHLVDYQVDVVVVNDAQLREQVLDSPFMSAKDHVTGEVLEVQDVVGREVIRRMHVEEGVKTFLTYQNKLTRAQRFADIINNSANLGLPHADHVNGRQKADVRTETIRQLGEREDGMVLTNVQIMNEGVDSPDLDAVVFMEPKYSTIDIMQCIGRALRLPKRTSKTIARIVVVTIVPDEIVDETLSDQARERLIANDNAFKPVLAVLRALEEHDNVIQETMESIRITGQQPTSWPKHRNRQKMDHIRIVGFDGLSSALTRRLSDSIQTVAARKPRVGDRYEEWDDWQKREDWIRNHMENVSASYPDAARLHDLNEPALHKLMVETAVRDGVHPDDVEDVLAAEYAELMEMADRNRKPTRRGRQS